ncbi:MAG: STAS domain-containing protein [Bryobacterales bacterium]|jgi:anti-sigma B factor antagonist|nr:STAS domain-containing protein [Bryobacterales bacterium]
MQFSTKTTDGITIVALDGKLVVGDATATLKEQVKLLADREIRKVVLDLKDVDYIDSSGLGTLVYCFSTFRKQGGTLKLLNLSRRNIELMLLTKLETVFEVFDDERSAVDSFFPDRESRRFDILEFLRQQQQVD